MSRKQPMKGTAGLMLVEASDSGGLRLMTEGVSGVVSGGRWRQCRLVTMEAGDSTGWLESKLIGSVAASRIGQYACWLVQDGASAAQGAIFSQSWLRFFTASACLLVTHAASHPHLLR